MFSRSKSSLQVRHGNGDPTVITRYNNKITNEVTGQALILILLDYSLSLIHI